MTKTPLFTRSMLLKSLSAFIISMLGPGVNQAFFKTTSETLYTSEHHTGTTPFQSPSHQTGISSTDPGLEVVEGVTEMGWGVYESYIWFMGMMLILEIVISSIKLCRLKQISGLNSSENLYKARQSVIVSVKKFIVYVVRMIFILTFYHLSYIVIFASLCFACNLYNNQGNTLMRQEPVLNNLLAGSSDVGSLHWPELDIKKKLDRNTRAQRMSGSSALSSEIIFMEGTNSVLPISSMITTAEEDIVLIATYSNEDLICTLNVVNFTSTTFPGMDISTSGIGSISFRQTTNVGPLSNNTFPLSLALSSDGMTVFMTTPSALQILKVVNSTYLNHTHSVSMSSSIFLYSVTLSPDDQTAFLLYYSFSAGYRIAVLDLTDLTSIESQEFITLNESASQPYYSLYTYGQSMLLSVSGLSFWGVYDISNVSNIALKGELDFRIFEGVQSVGFSSDYQTAYVGTSLNGFGYINIVNISGGVISNIISTTSLVPGFDIDYIANIVESPDGRHLFVSGTPTLQVFDISDPTSPIGLPPTDTPRPLSMVISPSGQKGIFAGEIGFHSILFTFNVELNQAINLQNKVIGTINISSDLNAIAFSPDSNTLYISVNSSDSNSLLVMNVSNPSNYTTLPSFPVTQPPIQMSISRDGEYLFALSTISNESDACRFEIYSIPDAQLLSPYYFNCSDISDQSFAITPDSNTAIIIATTDTFIILDITNKKTPSCILYPFFSKYAAQVTVSPDGRFAYMAGSSLSIIDISTLSSPMLVQSLADLPGPPVSITISNEITLIETAVFLVTKSADNTCYLNVISTIAIKPILLFSLELNDNCPGDFVASVLVPILPYGQTLFISLESSIIAIEMTDYTQPRLISVYSPPGPLSNIIGVSPDSSTLFTGTSQGLTMITLKPKHILYVDTLVSLGLPYLQSVSVLERNVQGSYDTKLNNYKFANVSLCSASSVVSGSLEAQKNIVFGNWANFDYNTGILSLSYLQTESLIGDYIIDASLSAQIPNTIFSGIGSINNIDDSIDLMVALVGLGYIDNEGYLTSSFDPDQTLLLGSEYMNDEVQIRRVMAQYYIQAWARFIAIESLEIYPYFSAHPYIFLNTPSLDTMTVNVTLENAQFVTLGYSFSASFSPDNRQVNLIGLLDTINDALLQLIVFLNGSTSCNGSISATDGLNPNMVKFISNISMYFNISAPPIVDNATFLDHLGSISPKTGYQFFIQFDNSLFTDSNNQPLTFSLKMQENSSEVPYWLDFKELTLVGTPPKQLTGRDLKLKIVVSNQYQSSEIDFTISVALSFEYIVQLIATYGGAFITVIGLYVYAARIYNILAKRVYSYSKKFVIKVGEEVTDKTLYPIAFHETALQESRLIMSRLDKTILTELKNNKEVVTKAARAGYFCKPDSYKLDQDKLCRMIEETATRMVTEDKTKLKIKLYTNGTDTDKKLIQQLIINNFVLRVLDLKEEKSTKATFERIKREIFSLVDLETCLENGGCKFSVNKTKLQAKLRDYKIKTYSLPVENEEGDINMSAPEGESSVSRSNGLDSFRSPHIRTQKDERNLEEELLIPNAHPQTRSGANIDLLTDAIEAYAFNSHILDTNVLQANIVVTQKMTNISVLKTIRKFLKWDLKLISSDKEGAIACGIEYQLKENILYFYGTANHTIKDKTIVLQIVTRRGRILRELWLDGIEGEPERKDILREKTISCQDNS